MRLSKLHWLFFLCFLSCAKEYSSEGQGSQSPDGTGTTVYQSTWEFKESATLYSGPVDTAYLTKETGRELLTITGRSLN